MSVSIYFFNSGSHVMFSRISIESLETNVSCEDFRFLRDGQISSHRTRQDLKKRQKEKPKKHRS